MTLDEYKEWFMNEMFRMPVSAWYRSTCVGGALIITDKAFKKMKSDPEWENMVRRMYFVNGIMGSKVIGFQVIGTSPEECDREGIPEKDNSGSSSNANGVESWWRKRHKRMEEIMDL